MLTPLIAIDLGSESAAVLVTGTFDGPVLLDLARWPQWDSEKIIARLKAWRGSKRGQGARIWCEETFSGPKWLRDVGRKQEAQAGFLEGMIGDVFERVPPCDDSEANAAWGAFGRPEQGKGKPGEHVRDALAVAWKALNRRGAGALAGNGERRR